MNNIIKITIFSLVAAISTVKTPTVKAIPVVVTNDITPLQLAMDIVSAVEQIAQMVQQVNEAIKMVDRMDAMVAETVGNAADIAHFVNQFQDGGNLNVMFNSRTLDSLKALDDELGKLSNWETEPWNVNVGVRMNRQYRGYISIDDLYNKYRKLDDIITTKNEKYKKQSEAAQRASLATEKPITENASQKEIQIRNLAASSAIARNTSAQFALEADQAAQQGHKERMRLEDERNAEVRLATANEQAENARGQNLLQHAKVESKARSGVALPLHEISITDMTADELPTK